MIEDLLAHPSRFEFFQAVRLLEIWQLSQSPAQQKSFRGVGGEAHPEQEAVRFRSRNSTAFAASEVVSLKPAEESSHWEMVVGFMGLTGVMGVLPRHYTTMLNLQAREKNPAAQDFFDLFNHRLISLFYRAWRKHHVIASYENGQLREGETDLFTRCLRALVGLGTRGLAGRMTISDSVLTFYSGTLAQQRRSAISLQQMLADHFAVPVTLEQFVGQWLTIADADLSYLPTNGQKKQKNCQLGVTTVLGRRVWNCTGKFRVTLGPLKYAQYRRFIPDGDDYAAILDLVRFASGAEFDFEIQPVLLANEVPTLKLGGDARLGWNAWLKSCKFENDFAGAAFAAA